MKSTSRRTRTLFTILAPALAVGMFLFSGTTVRADSVTTTVTAVGKSKEAPPEIKKDDVKLYSGKEQMQVANWRRGDSLFLAVLIDDSLDPRLAQNFNDLKAFFMAQPQSTYIAVAYSRNGTAAVAQDFTQDHALAAKALRLPLGAGGAFTSPYLSVQDWMKRWPDNGGDRRSIMMISSGVDYFRGSFDPVDPDLDSTISRAQKQNINIWAVYYPDQGHLGRRPFRAFNAQSNLSRLAEETGGEAYYLGSGFPVSLKPYFDEIADHLKNQYLLTFEGNGGKKGKFERIRLNTEVPKIEFMVPSEVFLPAE
jgi:VWFA-related protein